MDLVCATCRRFFVPKIEGRVNRFCSRLCSNTMGRAVRIDNLYRDAVALFWSRVDRSNLDGCWEYTGRRSHAGYGSVSWFGLNTYAHRVAFQLHAGPISRKVFILHRCDNPPCCRDSHLFPGTQAENVADMIAKGRKRWTEKHGEESHFATLTENEVRMIRASDRTGSDLARHLGVSKTAISLIRQKKTWRHVV